eukprot:437376-Pelagomonas_calceolata.AAC.1
MWLYKLRKDVQAGWIRAGGLTEKPGGCAAPACCIHPTCKREALYFEAAGNLLSSWFQAYSITTFECKALHFGMAGNVLLSWLRSSYTFKRKTLYFEVTGSTISSWLGCVHPTFRHTALYFYNPGMLHHCSSYGAAAVQAIFTPTFNVTTKLPCMHPVLCSDPTPIIGFACLLGPYLLCIFFPPSLQPRFQKVDSALALFVDKWGVAANVPLRTNAKMVPGFQHTRDKIGHAETKG